MVYIYLFVYLFIYLFIYLLFRYIIFFFCDAFYPSIFLWYGQFHLRYVDMCMCESDHRWRPPSGASWKQFLGKLASLYLV